MSQIIKNQNLNTSLQANYQPVKIPKQNLDIFSTHKNDINLPIDENTHKPIKFSNKDRNLKPVTYDYRKFVAASTNNEKNGQTFNEIDEINYNDNIQTQQSTQNNFNNISTNGEAQEQNQRLQNKSPLYDRLHTNTIQSQNSFQNGKQMSMNSQYKSNFESQYYQTQQQQALEPKSDEQMLDKLQIPNLLNPKQNQVQNSHYCDHGVPFHLTNKEDNLLVREVQNVLQKKEKNHQNIYKMLDNQQQVVGKLLKKYKKRSLQEEKILQQKMKEIQKLKNNYITLRNNEEMLVNLQIQIGIRMKDYKQNQEKMQDQIHQQKNFFENQYQQQQQQQQQLLLQTQNSNLPKNPRQPTQSPLFNKLSQPNRLYNTNNDSLNQSNNITNQPTNNNFYSSISNNNQNLPNFYQSGQSMNQRNSSQYNSRFPNTANTLVQSKYRSFSKNAPFTAAKQERRGKSSASIHNNTQYSQI